MNVDSSEFDTCVVSDVSHRFVPQGKVNKDVNPQYEEYSFRSDDRGIPIGVLTSCHPVGEPENWSFVLQTSKTFYMYNNILSGKYSYNLFRYPYQEDTLHIGNEKSFIKERLDSLIVQSETFHNVITCRHTFQQTGSLIHEITYAKGIGPIRKVYWDGSIWELIDHSIE